MIAFGGCLFGCGFVVGPLLLLFLLLWGFCMFNFELLGVNSIDRYSFAWFLLLLRVLLGVIVTAA